MKRRIFNITTGLSLLLFFAMVALWIRSYWRRDYLLILHVFWVDAHRSLWIEYDFFSDSGRVWAFRVLRGTSSDGDSVGWCWITDSQRPHPPSGFFHCHANLGPPAATFWNWPFIGFPHALAVFVFALLPLLRWRAWKIKKHFGTQSCRQCGYDLRATPERCPECGTVV